MVSVVLTEDPEDLRKKRKEQWWGAYNDTQWYVIEPMAFWKAACVAGSLWRLQRRRRVDAIDATPRRFDGCTALLLLVLAFYIPFSIAFLDVGDFIWFDWYQLVWFSVDTPEFLLALRERGGLGHESQVDRGGVLPVLFLGGHDQYVSLRARAGGVKRRVAAHEAAQDAAPHQGAARAQDDEADARLQARRGHQPAGDPPPCPSQRGDLCGNQPVCRVRLSHQS
jgi:hypothetical protein